MTDKQKLFWISKKSSYNYGKGKFTKYGQEVQDIIPDDMIPRFKKSGEIGTVEGATPEGVKTDKALENTFDQLKVSEEKLDLYKMAVDDVVKLLSQGTIKKDEKEAMVKQLEGLDND